MLALAHRPIAPLLDEEGFEVMTETAGDRLTRLETKFDVIIQQNQAAFTRLDTTHGDHETRLRSLERQVWAAFGGATVAGGLIGVITQILTSR